MKKRPLLLIIFVIIITLTLFAFPGAGSATDYVPNTTHTHYSIISSPFNEPITIEKSYNNYADALSAAKNMAHVAMYGEDVQSKIATLNNEEFINYLYDGLFHRTPEEAGFAGWLVGLNEGLSRSSMTDYFINSPEFEMRYVYGYDVPAAAPVVGPLVIDDGDEVSVTLSLKTYTPVTRTQTGDIAHSNVQYATAAAVITALPTTITVTLEDNTTTAGVPVTWADTDAYSNVTASNYTFTATWGALPAGTDNADSIAAPTVEVNVAAGVLAIGDSYEGGIIAYIFQDTDPVGSGYVAGEVHGLIAAKADQGTGRSWAKSEFQSTAVVGGTSKLIGFGLANTDKIITQNTAGDTYAAGWARAYTDAGDVYHDWFLPSKDELNKLRDNLGKTSGMRTAYGFASANYWSSSESSNFFAWFQNFDNGAQGFNNKSNTYYVRAVRAF